MSHTSEVNLPDGLDALLAELDLPQIMRLIERTARWVDPDTFQILPLWYPEYARGTFLYKGNWSEPQLHKTRQTNQTEHKREKNVYASKALTYALGLRKGDRPNWACCHIWGVDDARFQMANAVVQDRRFFSCVANMVMLPTPLKAFTDTMLEVKAMLRICARNLYGWSCEHDDLKAAVALIDDWHDWNAYPASWPRAPATIQPPGVLRLNNKIREDAARRLARIRQDMARAGTLYPRDEVRAALAYWNIVV